MAIWDVTDEQTDIGTDRLFSENIILDLKAYMLCEYVLAIASS